MRGKYLDLKVIRREGPEWIKLAQKTVQTRERYN